MSFVGYIFAYIKPIFIMILMYITATTALHCVGSHYCSRDAANIDGLGAGRVQDLLQVIVLV